MMKNSGSEKGNEVLLRKIEMDWSSVQAFIREFSEIANPAICFVDIVYPEYLFRVKPNDLLELQVALSDEDWDLCEHYAEGNTILGTGGQFPRWLQEHTDGVLSSATCLVSAPIYGENSLTIGFFYAFYAAGRPSEVVLEYQRALTRNCSLIIQQWQFHNRQKEQNDRLWKALEASCPGFLLLDQRNIIIESGSIYRKTTPEMRRGSAFQEFFAWDNVKSLDEIRSEVYAKRKLYFFHSLHYNQKYKCSAELINDRLLLILAAPVINSNHALSDYQLTSSDFAPQDYITDYVFLQTSTVQTLEETLHLNESIQHKNSELESLNLELTRAKVALEKKMDERNERVKRLSNFPEQNPNPVFEIDFKKQFLCFSNQAAKLAFVDFITLPYDELLSVLGLNHNLLCHSLRLRTNFTINGIAYDADAFRVINENIVRFYAHDVTDFHQAKDLLARQQKSINQLLNILEALNIDRSEAAKSTNILELSQEVERLLKQFE